ncbi:MAG: hypothetical protein LUC93_04810 [Planctomycetaceae bacterium]|nr:hypothetical protein [Planctomycetaceae bacterium]
MIGLLLTAVVVVLGFLYLLFKLLSANREAGLRFHREAEIRASRERELQERLERVKKKKDDLQLANGAVEKDPERAGKVVTTMMKAKK